MYSVNDLQYNYTLCMYTSPLLLQYNNTTIYENYICMINCHGEDICAFSPRMVLAHLVDRVSGCIEFLKQSLVDSHHCNLKS